MPIPVLPPATAFRLGPGDVRAERGELAWRSARPDIGVGEAAKEGLLSGRGSVSGQTKRGRKGGRGGRREGRRGTNGQVGSEFWSEAEDEACRTVLDKFVETGVGTGESQHYFVEEKERGWGGRTKRSRASRRGDRSRTCRRSSWGGRGLRRRSEGRYQDLRNLYSLE